MRFNHQIVNIFQQSNQNLVLQNNIQLNPQDIIKTTLNFRMNHKNQLCATDNGQQIAIQPNLCWLGSKNKAQKILESAPSQKIWKQTKKQQQIRKKKNVEFWELYEIQKLFILYAEYGSQWVLMQTQLKNRSPNSIKNRFYVVIRAFLRQLFISHPEIQNKKLHEIPSKIILRFYEGRKEFSRYKGLAKKLLKAANYDIESQELITIGRMNSDQIKTIYNLIYTKNVESTEKGPKSLNEPQNSFLPKINSSRIEIFKNMGINKQSQAHLIYDQRPKSCSLGTPNDPQRSEFVGFCQQQEQENFTHQTFHYPVNFCVGYIFLIN